MPKQFTLYPRKLKGKTIYYCQFRLPDGSRAPGRSTGCTSKNKAESWAIDNIKHIEHDFMQSIIDEKKKKGIFTGIDGNQITLVEFTGPDFFSWESRWAMSKRAGGKRLSPRHCIESSQLWNAHILPSLGDKYISDIDELALEDFRNYIYQQKYSDSLNRKCLLLIKAVLMAAKKGKLISHVPEIPETGNRQQRKGVLSLDEMKMIFSTPWRDYRSFVANLTAAASGARLSELQGLTIQDFNISEGFINIRHTWERRTKTLKDGTKNGRSRIIVIPERVCREINKLISMNPHGINPNAFVFFEYTKSIYPMGNKVFTDGLYDQMKKIGISEKQRLERHISFHSWRVFFNSICINNGIPTAKTQAQLGHLSLSMTNDVYYRPDNLNDIRELQEKIFITTDNNIFN